MSNIVHPSLSLSLSLALIHYPIKNKNGDIICTSVTNLDIHDIARSCKTFGLKHFFIVTPIVSQQELVARILSHWKEEKSLEYNPDRFEALGLVKVVSSFDDILNFYPKEHPPLSLATGANFSEDDGDVLTLRQKLSLMDKEHSAIICFGTGWGLANDFVERCHFRLRPIYGPDSYNHLSVRSAVAIYLEGLKGRK